MLAKALLYAILNIMSSKETAQPKQPPGRAKEKQAMKKARIITVETVKHAAGAAAWMRFTDAAKKAMTEEETKVYDVGLAVKGGTIYLVKWGLNVTASDAEPGKIYLKTTTSDYLFEVVATVTM